MNNPGSRVGYKTVLVGAIAGLTIAYLAGAFTAVFHIFPFPQLLDRPFRAITAQKRHVQKLQNPYETGLWHPVRFELSGVVRHDPNRSYRGYTFFTRSHQSAAVLIDMEGNVVHEWRLPFSEAWPSPPHTNRETPDSHIYWRRAKLFPNGDVIAIYTTVADTPYGYGMVKVDEASNIIWKHADNTHHDLAVDSQDRIYALDQSYRNTHDRPIDGMPQAPRLVLEDEVVRLGPDGRERDRFNLLDLIARSEYRHLLQMYAPGSSNPATDGRPGDLLHTNSIAVVGPEFARHHPFAEPGQVLVSFRPLDAIALISIEEEQIVWMSRGFWSAQHDPDPLPNGNLLVYDNQGHGGPGGTTRVLEFNPSTHAIEWMYTGDRSHPFQSRELGAQQRLPNGNVLITGAYSGRIFEVTPSGDIVWHYFNSARRTHKDQQYTSATLEATRFRPEALTFLSSPSTP